MIGANDIYFGRSVNAWQIVDKLELAIARLRDAGAARFLIGVPYSLALVPNGLASPDPTFDRFADSLRREIAKLRIRLSSREFKLKVAVLDVGAITARVADDPARYGFDPELAQVACLKGPYGGPRSLCDMPESYMWWDDVCLASALPLTSQFHPTRRLHEEFARDAETIIKRRLTSLGWLWTGWR